MRKLWLIILWLNYLEATNVAISKARSDAGFTSRIAATEKVKRDAKLGKHGAWSLEDDAERLRNSMRVGDFGEGVKKFAEVVG